jgi:hypothetical protein
VLIFILVTFVVPLLILGTDYVQKTELTLNELIEKSGPDLCSLSLGASVPIFLDPRVRTGLGEQGPVLEIIGILLIFLFRGLCVRFNRDVLPDHLRYAGAILGIGSVFFVGGIMAVGYLR